MLLCIRGSRLKGLGLEIFAKNFVHLNDSILSQPYTVEIDENFYYVFCVEFVCDSVAQSTESKQKVTNE